MELGPFGVWISSRAIDDPGAGEAAKLAEDLGFGALWLGGSPKLPQLRPLLAASERLVVATGILNVWANEPATVAAEYAELAGEFPGRVLLGIGIGHPEATSEYANPLETMAAFLDGLDAAPARVPRDGRCLAALGPRMLDLCGQRSLGAHPYFVPVAHTRAARARLGEDALLAPELTCVLDEDPERARAAARAFAERYLALRNYASNLERHGFTDADLAGGGSQRLLDEVVPQGSAAAIAAVARQHLDAGASHVCLQAAGVDGVPRAQWTALAGALLAQTA
jgi:probable F420-dependent oxidoreductase